MKRLKVKEPNGQWSWVFGRSMPEGTLKTTPHKHQALPSKPCWGQDDLEWARKTWPDREFDLSETLGRCQCICLPKIKEG